MRRIKFGSESLKLAEIMNYVGEGTPVCLELFVSQAKDVEGERVGIPYLWAVQIYDDMVWGRNIEGLCEFLEILRSFRVSFVYTFSPDILSHFLRGYFDISANSIMTSRREILKFGIVCKKGTLVFRSLSSISGAGTIEAFANIETQWNREVRTPETKLEYVDYARVWTIMTAEEKFISRLCEEYKLPVNIPDSLSSIIRDDIAESCFGPTKRSAISYQARIGKTRIYGTDEYANPMPIGNVNHFEFLYRAFQGGFTGANLEYVDEVCENVACYDFVSSYIARLTAYKYPMRHIGIYENLEVAQIKAFLDSDCLCVFKVKLYDLESISPCRPLKYNIRDKGPLPKVMRCVEDCPPVGVMKLDRWNSIVSAPYITLNMTSVDYQCLKMFYTCSACEFKVVDVYKAGYLPLEYVRPVIELFRDKSLNKGNPDKFIEDMLKKKVNITWGLMASGFNTLSFSVSNNDFDPYRKDLSRLIEDYNSFGGKYNRRTSCYQWALFCTAYARRDLFWLISRLGEDWLYSDTDSIFFFNKPEHIELIRRYNECIRKELLKSPHISSLDQISIKSSFVDKKYDLGAMAEEGFYSKFKFIKSKTYLCERPDGSYKMRMSGCSNINYSFFETVEPFDWFTLKKESYIPAEFCDFKVKPEVYSEGYEGVVFDCLGKKRVVKLTRSYVFSYSDYPLSHGLVPTTDEIVDYLLGG